MWIHEISYCEPAEIFTKKGVGWVWTHENSTANRKPLVCSPSRVFDPRLSLRRSMPGVDT